MEVEFKCHRYNILYYNTLFPSRYTLVRHVRLEEKKFIKKYATYRVGTLETAVCYDTGQDAMTISKTEFAVPAAVYTS